MAITLYLAEQRGDHAAHLILEPCPTIHSITVLSYKAAPASISSLIIGAP